MATRRSLEPSKAGGCVARPAGASGLGVFATREFREGDHVLTFRGPWQRKDELDDFTHTLEIGPGLFLGPSGQVDDYVNHSCEPNCRVDLTGDAPALRALRPIAAGEEVTYDYSTLMVEDPTTFRCACGAPQCRGVIGPYRTLPRELQRRYEREKRVPTFVVASRR
jgi:hypothetical protein